MNQVSLNTEQYILVTVSSSSESIEWVSDNLDVAIVVSYPYEDGDIEYSARIIAVGPGQCTITVTTDSESDTIRVNVEEAPAFNLKFTFSIPQAKS